MLVIQAVLQTVVMVLTHLTSTELPLQLAFSQLQTVEQVTTLLQLKQLSQQL